MSKGKYTFGIVIGRFQPFHNGHLSLVKQALKKCNHLMVFIGGAKAARSSKNPWTEKEREKMIVDSLTDEGVEAKRYTIHCLPDYLYNEQKWISDVQAKVMRTTKGNRDIALFGYHKDRSSYYLMSFPEWDFVPLTTGIDLDATYIRKLIFEENFNGDYDGNAFDEYLKLVPSGTAAVINDFIHTDDGDFTCTYRQLNKESEYITSYKEQQELYPYPINFVTTDAVVVKSGHILLIKRGHMPGKGTYALPGGFLNPEESIIEGTIRELREETNLSILPQILKEHAKETTVFDHPSRSLRGRTITHATYFDLGGGQLPQIKAGDDASDAEWMTIDEALAHPEIFYEDHHSIIFSFLMKY